MEALQNIKERRSIRQYKDTPVTAEQITEIVEAARFAPTWKNTQTVRYYAVLDKVVKDRIAAEGMLPNSTNDKKIRSAAALVVLTTVDGIAGYEPDGTPTTTKGTHWQSFDAGIACQTFCLAAHDKGLGTLIMGIYNESKIHEMLHLPTGESVSALIGIGYPEADPTAPPRKDVSEILTILG